jgi:hypothetical protein
MTPLVEFDSPEYACFHEAGHAELAIYLGARVNEIVLHRVNPRSFGRTRVDRTEQQRGPISLGGFAAEYILFRANRLRKQDGTAPSEKDFINYGMTNASDDLAAFYGDDIQKLNDDVREKLHRDFMSAAIKYAERNMQFRLVEQIADALLKTDHLYEADVNSVVQEFHTIP